MLGGKPYYLASAYPALLAAGGIALERRLEAKPSEQRTAAVLTGSYAQAAALNVLRSQPEPRAVTGHMNYYLWGPEPRRGQALVAYGLPRSLLSRHYRSVEERARIDAPLARPWDTDLPVYVCRERLSSPGALWSELRRFDHQLAPRD